MLYRKVNTEFEAWFKGTNKKALFVQGARQVGKTTTIREFCRSHYENFIELNFMHNGDCPCCAGTVPVVHS